VALRSVSITPYRLSRAPLRHDESGLALVLAVGTACGR
jgi:hypothetical protein